jgi:hypothetical protein
VNENNGELNFEEAAGAYPDFPRIIIRKMDTALRGVTLTARALERAKEEGALYDVSADLGYKTPNPCSAGRCSGTGPWSWASKTVSAIPEQQHTKQVGICDFFRPFSMLWVSPQNDKRFTFL